MSGLRDYARRHMYKTERQRKHERSKYSGVAVIQGDIDKIMPHNRKDRRTLAAIKRKGK